MSRSLFGHLPSPVAERLRSYYRRVRLLGFLRVLASTAVLYALLFLAISHADRFAFLDVSTRLLMFWIAHGATAAYGLIRLIVFLARRPTAEQVAYEFESRLPRPAEERFVTLSDVSARGIGVDDAVVRDLVLQLQAEAVAHSDGISPARLAKDRPLKAWGAVLLLLCAVCGALALPARYEFPLMAERFLFPERNLPKPSFIKIGVSPESIVVGKGGEVVVQAEIAGELPAPLAWLLRKAGMSANRCVIAMADGSGEGFGFEQAARADMSRVRRDLFLFSKGDLQEDVCFQIRCGDGQTAVHLARVVAQPKLLDVTLVAKPPAYSGLPDLTVTDLRKPVLLLAGSAVTVSFRTDQAVVRREIRVENLKEPVRPEWDEAARAGRYSFAFKAETAFEIAVANEEGFSNVDKVKVSLGMREDTPPSVRLEYPGGDTVELIAGELMPVQGVVEDDLGVSELAVRYVLNPTPDQETAPQEIQVPLEKVGDRRVPLATTFDLDKTRAVPGDVVAVRVRARDTGNNDGMSRETLVRIVPFARGEGERRRLAALRFLGEALRILCEKKKEGEKGPPAPLGPLDVEKTRYDAILALAEKRGFRLAAAPSMASILDFIEKEHHFTEGPRDKEDLRKLCGVVLSACLGGPAGAPEKAAEARAARLRAVEKEILPGLIGYRQSKNLLWRLFGMRYELERIRPKLEQIAQKGKPDPETEKSLSRRAELYWKTLEDINSDLLDLARATPAMDAPALTRMIGELNTNAHDLGRGSMKRRMGCGEKVAGQLSAMLTAVRPSLPVLFDGAREGRSRLDAAYVECIRWAASDAELGVGPGGQWLAADARLAAANPFEAFWPRFLNRVLARGALRGGPDGKREDAGALLAAPGGMLEQAIRTERAATDALAFASEFATVRDLDRISNTEKALELLLLGMEWGDRAGALTAERRARTAEAIARLDLAAGDAPLPEAAALETDAVALAKWSAAARNLAQASRARFPFPSAADCAAQLSGRAAETEAAFAAFFAAMKEGGTNDAVAALRKLIELLNAEESLGRGAFHDLFLALTYLAPVGKEDRADEVLYVRLGRELARHRARAADTQRAVKDKAGPSLNAGDLASLSDGVRQIAALHKTMADKVEALAASHRAGKLDKEEDKARSTVLEEYEKTRRYVAAAADLIEAADKAAVAKAFLKAFPESARLYIRSNASWIVSAEKAAADAEAALQKPESQDLARYDAACAESLRGLKQFQALLAGLGEAERQEGLEREVSALVGRAERLPAGGKPLDAVAITGKRYALAEVAKGIETVKAMLRGLVADIAEGEGSGFNGGPDGIWAKEHRKDAERTRGCMLRLAERARTEIAQSILEALKERPDARRYADGLAWSLFLHRLVRSELYGAGGVRTAGAAEAAVADPHLRWLRSEIEKALQARNLKHYAKATKVYLESLRDFLR